MSIKTSESDIFNLDLNRISKEMEEILFNYKNSPILDTFKSQLNIHIDAAKGKPFGHKCSSGYHVLALNLKGEILLCKNSNVVIGDLNTLPNQLLMRTIGHDKHLDMQKICNSCSVYPFCEGGCRINDYQEHFCNSQKALYKPIMKFLNGD